MPRHRSRSRSVYRSYDYESYSESSGDERGRPIGRFIDFMRPSSQSASIRIYNTNYSGNNVFDADTANGHMYQAGDRARATPRRVANNRGGNQIHHHHHHHYDDSEDDDDYYHGPRHCNCRNCEVAEAYKQQREKHEKIKKEADEAAKKLQKQNEATEKRLKAIKMGTGPRRLLRDNLRIDLDMASCHRDIENVRALQRQIRRSRSRSRGGVRWKNEDEEFIEIYTDA